MAFTNRINSEIPPICRGKLMLAIVRRPADLTHPFPMVVWLDIAS